MKLFLTPSAGRALGKALWPVNIACAPRVRRAHGVWGIINHSENIAIIIKSRDEKYFSNQLHDNEMGPLRF